MTEDIKIKITEGGESAKVAKEIGKITDALDRQRKAEEMIAKTSADIGRRNRVSAIQAEAAALNKLNDVFRTNAAGALLVDQSIAKAGAQFGQFRGAVGASAALVGNLGNSFSQLVPAAAGMTGALQSGGMAMSQFLGVLGGGPGILLGGAVAAVGLIATYFANAKREADDLAEATKKNAAAMGSYLDQIGKLRGQITAARTQKSGEADLGNRLGSNRGSVDEYQDDIALQRKRLENPYYSKETIQGFYLAGNRDEVVKRQQGRSGIEALIAQRQGGLTYAQQNAAAAAANAADRTETNAAAEAAAGAGLIREGGAKKASGSLGMSDSQSFMMEQAGSGGTVDQVMRAQAQADALIELQDKKNAALLESDQRLLGYQQEMNDAWFGMVVEGYAKEVEIKAKTKAQKQSVDAAYTAYQIQGMQMVTGAALKGISELVKGKKVEAGAILESLGDQFVAQGTGAIFQGLVISATPPVYGLGAGMIAAGAAEVAFGLSLGAVGARGAGGSNSGGGGGGAKPSTGYDDRSPYRDSFSPSGESGPTTIYITMPTVTSPTAEDGIRIREALGRANLVYGKAT